MIEVRGVLNSPLIAFDESSGCAPCVGSMPLIAKPDHRQSHDRRALERRPGDPAAVRGDRRVHAERDGGQPDARHRPGRQERAPRLRRLRSARRAPEIPAAAVQRRGHQHGRRASPRGATRSATWISAMRIGERFNVELPSGSSQPATPDLGPEARGNPRRRHLLHHDGSRDRPERDPPLPRPGIPARRASSRCRTWRTTSRTCRSPTASTPTATARSRA